MTQGKYLTDNLFLTTGYIKAPALKNRVYLNALTDQQTVAQCLVDLSHGYIFKFGYDDFVEQCSQTALHFFPHDLSALMMLFNARQVQMDRRCVALGVDSMERLRQHKELVALHEEQSATIGRIESLGHVAMPQKEYETWLHSLNAEKQRRTSCAIREQMK